MNFIQNTREEKRINPRHHPSLDQHKRLNRKNNVNPIIYTPIYIGAASMGD
jgi:hypothetical protein